MEGRGDCSDLEHALQSERIDEETSQLAPPTGRNGLDVQTRASVDDSGWVFDDPAPTFKHRRN